MRHVFLMLIVMMTACAKPQFVSGRPHDPDLAQKLRLSQREWKEIQAEFQAGDITQGYKPILWARSRLTGAVEVHCVNPKSPSPAKSGPVFFFDVRDGHWRLLSEMSQWKEMSEWRKYKRPPGR